MGVSADIDLSADRAEDLEQVRIADRQLQLLELGQMLAGHVEPLHECK